jgi:GTP-binding protein HflX
VWLSAKNEQGLELVGEALQQLLGTAIWRATLQLQPSQGALRAQLFALDAVEQEAFGEQGQSLLTVSLKDSDKKRLEKQFSLELETCVETPNET